MSAMDRPTDHDRWPRFFTISNALGAQKRYVLYFNAKEQTLEKHQGNMPLLSHFLITSNSLYLYKFLQHHLCVLTRLIQLQINPSLRGRLNSCQYLSNSGLVVADPDAISGFTLELSPVLLITATARHKHWRAQSCVSVTDTRMETAYTMSRWRSIPGDVGTIQSKTNKTEMVTWQDDRRGEGLDEIIQLRNGRADTKCNTRPSCKYVIDPFWLTFVVW